MNYYLLVNCLVAEPTEKKQLNDFIAKVTMLKCHMILYFSLFVVVDNTYTPGDLREFVFTEIVSFCFQPAGSPFSLIGPGSTQSGLPVSPSIPLPQRPPSSLDERKPSTTIFNHMKQSQSSSAQPVTAPSSEMPTLQKASNRYFINLDVIHLIYILFLPYFASIFGELIYSNPQYSHTAVLFCQYNLLHRAFHGLLDQPQQVILIFSGFITALCIFLAPLSQQNILFATSSVCAYGLWITLTVGTVVSGFGSALNIETLVAAAERRETPVEVFGYSFLILFWSLFILDPDPFVFFSL